MQFMSMHFNPFWMFAFFLSPLFVGAAPYTSLGIRTRFCFTRALFIWYPCFDTVQCPPLPLLRQIFNTHSCNSGKKTNVFAIFCWNSCYYFINVFWHELFCIPASSPILMDNITSSWDVWYSCWLIVSSKCFLRPENKGEWSFIFDFCFLFIYLFWRHLSLCLFVLTMFVEPHLLEERCTTCFIVELITLKFMYFLQFPNFIAALFSRLSFTSPWASQSITSAEIMQATYDLLLSALLRQVFFFFLHSSNHIWSFYLLIIIHLIATQAYSYY